jgi:hypothetical protein
LLLHGILQGPEFLLSNQGWPTSSNVCVIVIQSTSAPIRKFSLPENGIKSLLPFDYQYLQKDQCSSHPSTFLGWLICSVTPNPDFRVLNVAVAFCKRRLRIHEPLARERSRHPDCKPSISSLLADYVELWRVSPRDISTSIHIFLHKT